MKHTVANGNHGESECRPANTKIDNYLMIALCSAAIAPLLHTIITWDSDGRLTSNAFAIRHLSIPVIIIEIFIVWISSLSALDLRQSYQNQILFVKCVLSLWGALALFTSLFYSNQLVSSIFFTGRYILHIVVLVSICDLVSRNEYFDTGRWLIALTVGSMLYLLSLLIFIYLTRNEVDFPWALRLPSATNVRQIGNLLSILAIAPIAALLARDQAHKALYFMAVTLIVGFVAWTGTRGGILGLAVGSTFGILLAFKFTSGRNIALLALSCCAGFLISTLFFRPAPDFGLFRMVESLTSGQHISAGRAVMWTDTTSEILRNPFLGFGSGSYRENMLEKYQFDFNHPHNVILQYIYDWGIFGGTAALIMLAWLGWRLLSIDNPGSTLRFLSIGGFCATLAIAMIEGTLFHPLPILAAILMIAPALGSAARSGLPDHEGRASVGDSNVALNVPSSRPVGILTTC